MELNFVDPFLVSMYIVKWKPRNCITVTFMIEFQLKNPYIAMIHSAASRPSFGPKIYR